MSGKQKIEKLKLLVDDTHKINDQLKIILKNMTKLSDVIENGEGISERVHKTFQLYSEFIELIKD